MRPGRIRAALAAALLASGWTIAGLASAPAAHAAGCSTTSGVTVVVDFGPLGGGVQVGCAGGGQPSGLDALSAAGFTYTFVPRQVGLVCQLDARPSPCNGAPANAYWSYWHGRPGGSWSYSTLGAGSYAPPAGSAEGWAFGAGAQPGAGPPALPAPPPPARPPAHTTAHQPAPPPAAPGGGGGSKGTGGTGARPTGTGAGAAGTAPASSSGAAAPGRRSTPATSPTTAAPGPATTTGVPRPVADQRSGGGGVGPGVIVTLLLVLALVGLAGFARYRRRAASH